MLIIITSTTTRSTIIEMMIMIIIIMKMMVIVTRPFYENRLNWIPDPAPPAPRRLDDLTSLTPASTIHTPPSEVHPSLLKRLRPRRRRKRKTTVAANDNSASREADLATPLELSANRNSFCWASRLATRPRSAANDLPGFQPGTRGALKKHPHSFTSSQSSQHPDPAANQNRDRPFCQDHSEIRGGGGGGFISRPRLTPDRIRLPIVREITSPDSASPHLLSSNPLPNPSLDRLLGI